MLSEMITYRFPVKPYRCPNIINGQCYLNIDSVPLLYSIFFFVFRAILQQVESDKQHGKL